MLFPFTALICVNQQMSLGVSIRLLLFNLFDVFLSIIIVACVTIGEENEQLFLPPMNSAAPHRHRYHSLRSPLG